MIYPKYAERALLEIEKINKLGAAPKETEIEALRLEDTGFETIVLLSHDSPAAKWVSEFHSDKYGTFNLPSLLAAMELQHQKSDIDELAKTIEGADLLRDFTSYVWSCSRCNENLGWIAYGYSGFAGNYGLYGSNLAVPLVLYR